MNNPLIELQNSQYYLRLIEMWTNGMEGNISNYINHLNVEINIGLLERCKYFIKNELLFNENTNILKYEEIRTTINLLDACIKRIERNLLDIDLFVPYYGSKIRINKFFSIKINSINEFINESNLIIDKYGKFLKSKDIKEKITSDKNISKKTSYLWQSNPENELPELYNLMIKDYKLIAPDTTYEQFEAVFTGQAIDSVEPIKWLGAKNLNAYFIEQLIEKKKLSKAVNNDVWKTAKFCFADGSNFSQLIDLYNNNKTGKPKNHNLIDNLLNAL
jgi:hypothetical protein